MCLFQVIVQLHFMIVLYIMGTSTTIEGMDAATFTRNVGKKEIWKRGLFGKVISIPGLKNLLNIF
jgi:hypothetical protein